MLSLDILGLLFAELIENHFWGDVYEEGDVYVCVYTKLLSCCTDKLSHGLWPSLLQGGTTKSKTKEN